MELKEVVTLAKDYVMQLFADERITKIALEEVELNSSTDSWLVTVSFLRNLGEDDPANWFALAQKARRIYKTIQISNTSGQVLAIRDHQP